MKLKFIYSASLMIIFLSSCSENYSNGERIGLITQFSHKGLFWKSWEGQLNLTQTGMNSSGIKPFEFSLDNENENAEVIKQIDSAANYGWKVKLVYHETKGKNWFDNRGNTNHFIEKCIVLDKNPVGDLFKNKSDSLISGKVRDTIYLVIYRDKK
jgi:hypothetical protein